MAETDADVIRRSMRDPELFAELVERHGPAIWRFLARRSGRDTADDVLADVFTAAFEKRSSYDGTYVDARPWLYGIARNCLQAHWRQHRPIAATPWAQTDDPWAAVDDRLDADSCSGLLRAGLRALAPDDRDVLLLVAWEQLTPTEAAAVVGIPAGTARSRLHRARATLKLALPQTRLEISHD